MPTCPESLEETKREIRGALAFAEDAIRRANDSMELSPGDPVDQDYMQKQLDFVLRFTHIALRLVAESRDILDGNAPKQSPEP